MTGDLVEDFIAAGGSADDEAFDRVALEVFTRQYEAVDLYRRLCDLRGARPGSVDHWSRIPAAPADLFREDLAGENAPAGDDGGATFLSSGTTQGSEHRSRHRLSARGLALYRRSSLAWFRHMVLPDRPEPMSVLVLGPTDATHPDSSLGHMYGFVGEHCATGSEAATSGEGSPRPAPRVAQAFGADGRLDLDAALAWLDEAEAGSIPVLILALRSTVTALFEALRDRRRPVRLPADSRLVDTGGAKGGRTFSRAGIRNAAWRFLHIPSYLCVEEYGMTELLSQFYDDALYSRWAGALRPRAKVGPPWTRTLVVDPATLEPVADGERGILRHVDLANVGSIAAVQTLDLGQRSAAGFEVLGRASGAEARGCSHLMSVLRP